MALRPPSIDHGVQSGMWAVGLGIVVLLGLLGIGIDAATAFIVSPLVAAAIFVFIRLYGEEDLRRNP